MRRFKKLIKLLILTCFLVGVLKYGNIILIRHVDEQASHGKQFTTSIDCENYLNNPTATLPDVQHVSQRLREIAQKNDDYFSTVKCEDLISKRYILSSQSQEEAAFPLAYTLIIYKQFSQFERLLRAIYRPEHTYCVHADKQASRSFHRALHHVASCFSNVHVADQISVKWGDFSVLQVELNCMKILLKNNSKWKYLINLTGQEFPLRTNLELIRILNVLNGANLVEGTVKRRTVMRIPKTNAGFNITWMKGSVHIVAQRGFVHYAVEDWHAKRLLSLLFNESYSKVPDEQFFATLNHNPNLQVPGAYLGLPETDRFGVDKLRYPFLARIKNWFRDMPCTSNKQVKGICIWGILDLPFLIGRKELFVNKFYEDFHPFALDCIEEWYTNRTNADFRRGDTADSHFDINFYKNLHVVQNHI